MYKAPTTVCAITMIATIFCCVLIAAAQPIAEGNSMENAQNILEKNPTEKVEATPSLKGNPPVPKGLFAVLNEKITAIKNKIASYIPSDSKSQNERAFDFSTNGDDILQNFNFFAKVPFEFEAYEVSLNGKYRQTFQKKDTSSAMEDPYERKPLPKWKTLSKSYALGFEVNNTHKFRNLFTLGGYFDFERDFSIEMDPHVHVSIFTESPLFAPKGLDNGWCGALGRRTTIVYNHAGVPFWLALAS